MGCNTDSTHNSVELVSHDYIWHNGALRWQTPDISEQWIAGIVALADQDFDTFLCPMSMTLTIPALVVSHRNDDTAYCIFVAYSALFFWFTHCSINNFQIFKFDLEPNATDYLEVIDCRITASRNIHESLPPLVYDEE